MFLLDVSNVSGSGNPKPLGGPVSNEPVARAANVVATSNETPNVDRFDTQLAQNDNRAEPNILESAETKVYFAGLKKVEVKPSGIHNGDDIPADIRKKLENGEIRFEDLTQEQQKKILVEPGINDVLDGKQQGKKKIDWIVKMKVDGVVYKYNIIPPHGATPSLPTAVEVKNDSQNVDPKSIKYIFYRDPVSKEVKKGIYFELSEKAIGDNKGGVNGMIISSDRDTVIFNNTKSEAYIIKPKPPAPVPSVKV